LRISVFSELQRSLAIDGQSAERFQGGFAGLGWLLSAERLLHFLRDSLLSIRQAEGL
jgi:hypothetical protein